MPQQTVARTIGMQFGSGAGIDVVIHLDIPDAIFLDQPINHTIQMRSHLRIAEIQLITAMVDNRPSIP